jgi:hypothetical protein
VHRSSYWCRLEAPFILRPLRDARTGVEDAVGAVHWQKLEFLLTVYGAHYKRL